MNNDGELKTRIRKKSYMDDWMTDVTACEDSDKIIDEAKKDLLDINSLLIEDGVMTISRKKFEKWFGDSS